MSELCSQCGKALTPDALRCPRCQAELAVTLPGTQAPLDEEGKVPLPSPKAGGEASPAAESESTLYDLFDDFDPMEEFGPATDSGQTLGGFELTPPTALEAPLGGDDDVLDFIDTVPEEPPQASSAGPADAAELPEMATEVGLIGYEEAAKEGEGEASKPAGWPDYLDPALADPPVAHPPSSQPAQSPHVPSPPLGGAFSPPPSPPGRGGELPALDPVRAPINPTLRRLRLGAAGGGVAALGVLLFFFVYSWMSGNAPKAEVEAATPPQRAEAPPAPAATAKAEEEEKAEAAEAAEEAENEAALAEAEDQDSVSTEDGASVAEVDGAEGELAEMEEGEAAEEGEAEPDFFAEARAFEREEKWDEALVAYLSAAGPEKGAVDEAHLRRSQIYLRLGDLPRALLEARRAVSENGERLDARLHLGGIFESLGSLRDAAETYQAALASHPEDRAALERLALLHLEMGAPWQAIELLEPKVGAEAPAGLRLALGEAYLAAGSWARAGSTLAPLGDEPAAAYPRARALLEQGKLREALPHLERAAAREEVDPIVHRHLGFVYKELRRRREAASAFRAYLDEEPEALDRREIEDEIATLTR